MKQQGSKSETKTSPNSGTDHVTFVCVYIQIHTYMSCDLKTRRERERERDRQVSCDRDRCPRWAVYSNQSKMANGDPFPFPVHEVGCDKGFVYRVWGLIWRPF